MGVREIQAEMANAMRRGPVGGPAAVAKIVLARLFRNPADRAFDRSLLASTAERVPAHELGVESANSSHAVEYAPTPSAVFRALVGDLPRPLERFDFVDFGSGKGRVLMLAARFPFKTITGVEFSPELHAVASDNIKDAKLEGRVTSVLGDAAAYEIPAGPCVFYLYNPFGEPVIRSVRDNILASFARSPRPMFIIYYNPKYANTFEAHPGIKARACGLASRLTLAALSDHDVRIYEVAR